MKAKPSKSHKHFADNAIFLPERSNPKGASNFSYCNPDYLGGDYAFKIGKMTIIFFYDSNHLDYINSISLSGKHYGYGRIRKQNLFSDIVLDNDLDTRLRNAIRRYLNESYAASAATKGAI